MLLFKLLGFVCTIFSGCAFVVVVRRLQLDNISDLKTVSDNHNHTSNFLPRSSDDAKGLLLLRGNNRSHSSSEFHTTPIVSSRDTPPHNNNAWRFIRWWKADQHQESIPNEDHKQQWQETYTKNTRQFQPNTKSRNNIPLKRRDKVEAPSILQQKEHPHEMQQAPISSEKRESSWKQQQQQLLLQEEQRKKRRVLQVEEEEEEEDIDEGKQLPEKGDTDCDSFTVDEIISDILYSNSTAPIFTSFLPLPRPCRDEGADGTVEEDAPIIPPLSELLFNPDKNVIPIMFAVALQEPLEYDISELKEPMTELVTSFLNRAFTFDNYGDTIALAFQNPKEINGDGTRRRIQSTGGTTGSRFNGIAEERRIQSDFDGGVWTMTHKSTDIERINEIRPPEHYSWWKVTVSYKVFKVTEDEALQPESDRNALTKITKEVRFVVEEAVSNAKFLSEMRSKLDTEEVWAVEMAGQEPPRLTEPASSAEEGASRGPKLDGYEIRQDIGLVLVFATSFSSIIMFFLASKRKELRKEQRLWGIRFTESGLIHLLRYGYKIEKGGVMITTDFGPRGPGYSDGSSIYKGESSQPYIFTEIVTSETLYNIASQQQHQLLHQQQIQHNTVHDTALAGGGAYMDYAHVADVVHGETPPAAVLPNQDIDTNIPAGANPKGMEKREKSLAASDRTPAAETDPTRNISAASPPTPIVNTPFYNKNVFPSNDDTNGYDDDDDDGSSYI